jgi:capsid portal protein
MGSHILQLPFLFKDVAAETGQTEETVKESIKASFATFQGAENAAKLLMLENNIKDADGKMVPIEIKKIDLQNYDGIFEKTENTVKDTLRGQYRCPAILLDPVSTGFSVDIMDAAYNYYNNLTGHDRQIFEEVMMELFTNFVNPQILPESYAIIPLKYLSNDTTSNI